MYLSVDTIWQNRENRFPSRSRSAATARIRRSPPMGCRVAVEGKTSDLNQENKRIESIESIESLEWLMDSPKQISLLNKT